MEWGEGGGCVEGEGGGKDSLGSEMGSGGDCSLSVGGVFGVIP